MEKVKSIGALIGVAETEIDNDGAKETRVAAQNVWLSDLKGAPDWLVRKYFTNDMGMVCGRMHVKSFARIGETLTENGQVVLNRWGKAKKLATGYLAKKVEEDLASAGYPDIRIHFKGYSLDPVRFASGNAFLQEEYEENEARHVPGLDEDEGYEPSNAQAPLDRRTWESLACFMMNALRAHTLMYWDVDEDFSKVLSATDFVHVAYNAYLNELWARLSQMITPKTTAFASEHSDFAMFEAGDVIRTYMRAMRFLTGKEYGESMLEDAALLDPELDAELVKASMGNVAMGTLSPENAACAEEMAALILLNADPTDEAPEWDYETGGQDLLDDDAGDLATGLLLRY